MTPVPVAVSVQRRTAAVTALCCWALLVAALVVFMTRNWHYAFLALAGFAVAVGGAWWMITETAARRLFGVVGLAVGVAGIVTAVVLATAAAEQPVARVLVVLVLLAVAVGTSRSALVREVHPLHAAQPRHLRAPAHPVLICNPWSGGGKVERFGLLALAAELGIETVVLGHGLDLEELARDAVARGADCLGMAGGDGSQALVASIAIEHGLPFVCVTAGTRNHFALDLGLDREDPRKSMYAFRDAAVRHIDVATVNGRLFVNNVSLGIYATIVQQDAYRDAKTETTKTLLPQLLGRTTEPFDLQFTEPDGTEVDGAFLIQVSNNPYVIGASPDASQRRALDTGKLGVFAVNAASGVEAAHLFTMTAVGGRRLSPYWHEFTADRFELRSRSGKAFAGIDGEALELETPLDFRIHPGELTLLVPEDNLAAAERRRARDVHARDLFSIAAGHDPSARRDAGPPA